MEPLVSLITATISISDSTCCLPGTHVCRIPLGKLLKQLLVSICGQKQKWPSLLESKKFDVGTDGSDRERHLQLEMLQQRWCGFCSNCSVVLKGHLICVNMLDMSACVCACVFCCQLCLFLLSHYSDILPSLDSPLKCDQCNQYESLLQSLLVI